MFDVKTKTEQVTLVFGNLEYAEKREVENSVIRWKKYD